MNFKTITIILSLLIASNTLFSQGRVAELRKKQAEDAQTDKMFGDNDADFQVSVEPEKWKAESAVILCQKFNYNYLRKGSKKIIYEESTRTRLKLNDKSAIEDFSIFYYRYSSYSEEHFGIKLIKPDGTETTIDLEDAVTVASNEVPSYYKQSYSSSYKKIAIPNLEKGDILDYYYSTKKESINSGVYSFTPLIFTLAGKYPVLNQKYYFNVDRGFKVSFRTYNGAGDIVEGDPGVDKKGKVRSYIRTFEYEDTDRDKIKSEYWKYSYLEEPTIKLQVNFVGQSSLKSTSLLVNETSLINDVIDLKAIQNHITKQSGNITGYDETISYIKRFHKNEKDPNKLAELAYYYLRYKFFSSIFFSYYSSYSKSYLAGEELPVVDYRFTNALVDILYKLKVDCKYVIAVNRKYGTFDDVLLKQELVTGVKVGDQYFFYFTNFSTHDYVPSNILGSEAIEFSTMPNNKYEGISYEKTTLPTSNHTKNHINYSIDTEISEDLTQITFNTQNTFKGYLKNYYIGIAMYNVKYFEKDKMRFDPKYKVPVENYKGNKVRVAEAKRAKAATEKEKNDKKYKYLKNYHNDDYELESYDNFEVISDGRFADSLDLIYKEEYVVNKLINKAGRNYIISLGKFIGEQFQLEKEDMERSANINLSYAKSYTYDISLKIPDGYKVEGLDKFNVSVDNEMGAFTCKATVENSTIKLMVNKKYKVQSADKSEWPKFIAFLEEAYNFTQQKVVIKKAN